MRIRKLPIHRIKPASYNPRRELTPDDPEYQKLVRSLDEFGCVEPLVWNQRTGNLVGGHQRLKVLVARGAKEVSVSVVDLPLEKEKALNLALNKITGEWDQAKLTELLEELIQTPEFDIELTGFDSPEIEDLLNTLEDDVPETDPHSSDEPAVTQPGELIALGLHGEHRLLCGDVTDPASVARLLGEHRARLCHTDPPYGVSYDPRNRPQATPRATQARPIHGDDLSPQRYRCWFPRVVDAIDAALAPGSSFYIWNSHRRFGLMHDLLTDRGFKIASVITWAKESFSPNFGDYNEQVEYCLYGWKGGARHRWYGPKNETTLWEIHRDRTDLYRHPTQKALALADRAIRNSSKRGDGVFDPFLGSGTTLIAAARLGRHTFGMEIEPRYCDIIVRRYMALAGEGAVSEEIAARYRTERVPS